MAIGFPPLIPLDRVVPDPNARFERFGEDDTELFGKPLDTAIPDYQPAQPSWTATSLFTMTAQTQQTTTLAPDYNSQAATVIGTSSTATLGTYVNLTG
jgi:hypothetical protein